MNLLEEALAYAARGWSVFPVHGVADGRCTCGRTDCAHPGKHPKTGNGVKAATTDPAQIRAWDWTGANIAVAAGESGLVVLDIDPRNDGFASAIALKDQYGPLPDTLTANTGGGGLHLYFLLPTGQRIGNSVGKVAAGIDVRACGGYVILPPSLHASGNAYAWRKGPVDSPQQLPAWLAALMVSKPEKATGNLEGLLSDIPSAAERWLTEALTRATEGNRNDSGLWLVCQLRDAGLAEPDAAVVMRQYAARCPRGDAPYTEREALATCRSAYSTPARAPAASQVPAPIALFGADPSGKPDHPPMEPVNFAVLAQERPERGPPVIDGILREGAMGALISSSKARKSWAVAALIGAALTGGDWFGHAVAPGRVLLIDGELTRATIYFRLTRVFESLQVPPHAFTGLDVFDLRGRTEQFHHAAAWAVNKGAGYYRLIVVDCLSAIYPRPAPDGRGVKFDENSNSDMRWLMDQIITFAGQTRAAVLFVHHFSKGAQFDKAVVDLGAGAGAIARAVDAHLAFRPHQQEECVVLEGRVRDFVEFSPTCWRFVFPVYQAAPELDPMELAGRKPRRRSGKAAGEKASKIVMPTLSEFCSQYLSTEPREMAYLTALARPNGISSRAAGQLIKEAVAMKKAFRWTGGPKEPVRYATVMPPENMLPGISTKKHAKRARKPA